MVNKVTKDWIKYTEVNNTKYEVVRFGSNGQGKVLIVEDFLKYPDQFYNLVKDFPFFDNIFSGAMSGQGFTFPKIHTNSHGKFLIDSLSKIFGTTDVHLDLMSIACMNGGMETYSYHPHVDLCFSFDLDQDVEEIIRGSNNIASNIGLTKGMNVGTAMWSYKGKCSILEMTNEEVVDFVTAIKFNHDGPLLNWKLLEEDENWKIEFLCPLSYNTWIIYPTFQIHAPYLDENWFTDSDRITSASFIKIKTENLDPLKNF